MSTKLLKAAYKYISNGVCVIATNNTKRAFLPWKQYQETIITIEEAEKQFEDPRAASIAIICGKPSGNLEVVDIDVKYDVKGTLYKNYTQAIKDNAPALFEKLLIVQTVSKGYHIYYRCEQIEGNMKLASRPVTEEEKANDPNVEVMVLIETRGQGGYVIAPPSEGYKVIQGDAIPTITADEREILIELARSFNEVIEAPVKNHTAQGYNPKEFGLSPFEDYNRRGDVVELLVNHGWKVIKQTPDKFVFRRPGKNEGTSGDYWKSKQWFSVFTTSSQFQPNKAYLPYAVFAMLECRGDFKAAAKKLLEMGYGEKREYFGNKLERTLFKKKQEGMSQEDMVSFVMKTENKKHEDAVEVVEKLNQVWGEKICTFWDVSENGGVSINRTRLINFLHTVGGFSLYYYDSTSTIFKVVKCKNGFIEEVSTEHLKKFLKGYIESLPDTFDGGITSTDLMELILKGANTFFSDAILEFLTRSDFDFLQDTPTEAYFPFRNGVVKVTKEDIQLCSYNEIKKVIWKSQVIDYDIFIEKDLLRTEFGEFVNLISGNNAERYDYACTLIGYMLHKYKDISKTFAIILAEENDDENKGGGTGKGLFISAISKLTNVQRVDGKNFKVDKSFAFQRVNLDTKLVVIEDTRKNVDFEGFYTMVTEGITVEKKNKDELFIHYKDSPKFVFTTNYTISGVADHAKRRQMIFEFSNYFSASNTPVMHFKHLLFEDWDKDEWNRFYNFMFLCVQEYLNRGILKIEATEKIKRKNLKVKYGEEFLFWWDGYVENGCETFHACTELYSQFLSVNTLERKDYSQTKFGKAMYEAGKTMFKDIVKQRNREANNRMEIKVVKS